MPFLKKVFRFSGILLIGLMFAVCMIVGVVPVLPKRKEQFVIETGIENTEQETKNTATFKGDIPDV